MGTRRRASAKAERDTVGSLYAPCAGKARCRATRAHDPVGPPIASLTKPSNRGKGPPGTGRCLYFTGAVPYCLGFIRARRAGDAHASRRAVCDLHHLCPSRCTPAVRPASWPVAGAARRCEACCQLARPAAPAAAAPRNLPHALGLSGPMKSTIDGASNGPADPS